MTLSSILDWIKNLFQNKEFISLAIFFLITITNQLVAVLKTVFMASKAEFATYITVAIDAVLYSLMVKSLTEQTYLTVILFVLGKLIGTFIANKLESRIAIGIYDIELFVKDHDRQKELQDKLIENGFSSTMNIGTITDNDVRWSNSIQIKRKDMSKLYDILTELGIDNPTMVIRHVKKVTGNIKDRI